MAKTNVVLHQHATLAERIDTMREEAAERHAAALAEAREAVDARIVDLVRSRTMAAVDALLKA